MSGKQRDTLTNEYLTKYFPDNFSLALTSINAAKALMESGKEFRLAQLLESVARSKSREMQEAKEEEEEEIEEASCNISSEFEE